MSEERVELITSCTEAVKLRCVYAQIGGVAQYLAPAGDQGIHSALGTLPWSLLY